MRWLALITLFMGMDHVCGQNSTDDCATALSQFIGGISMAPPSFPPDTLCEPNGTLNTPWVDSTNFYTVSFPFPNNPSCINANTGKDIWMAGRVYCALEAFIYTSDTCKVSFWSGSDCAFLTPLTCITAYPNTTNWAFAHMASWSQSDTVLIQVVSKSNTDDVSFSFCMRADPPCAIFYSQQLPTPVTCFDHFANTTSASSISNSDGSANIQIIDGNPPYSIFWNSGDTTFTIDNLLAGTYTYTITDGVGCVQTDSVVVGVDTSVVLNDQWNSVDPSISPNPNIGTFTLKLPSINADSDLQVYDINGRLVHSEPIASRNTFKRVQLDNALANGLYQCRIVSLNSVGAVRFVLER